ncbi:MULTISPECIES: hypothetical protein [Arenibacter]|uniref:hypothetical protein n=1 Tax=Arenibacter TaxID=178469 RepID=UPI001C07C2FF|nr:MULTISPECIES: hypothetical protein [Arenibacter]MBU2903665.1 hypothetical protein [Arenibacter algicola]MCK0134981.1 hypothetical protein [Arenibacter sp. S6351L]
MSKNHLPSELPTQIQLLQAEINRLQMEINEIIHKTSVFENLLRAEIEDELIEEQELSLLYKQQKKAKKAKRLAQKQRGKNYDQTGILTSNQSKPIPEKNSREQQLRKQLYREAMLYVHPDKFSMQTDKLDLATEITTQLIEIYRSGDLAALKAYHAHIFSGNTLIMPPQIQEPSKGPELAYLKMELKKLQEELAETKNRHTYKVLTEYKNPMSFVDELKAYYKDRLMKLRKRTRSK